MTPCPVPSSDLAPVAAHCAAGPALAPYPVPAGTRPPHRSRLPRPPRLGLATQLACAAVFLAACGGGGEEAAPPAATPAPPPSAPAPAPDLNIAGRAAIGAALASATVDIKCTQGSGQTTTDATGAFTATVAAGVAPCALRVTRDALRLHGYAAAAGDWVNLTPLTDLIIGRATTQLPAQWFDGSVLTLDSAALASARDTVLQALAANGAVLPAGNPLNLPFVIGDAWDRVLDRLVAAIATAAGQPALSGLAALEAGYGSVLAGAVAGHAAALPALDPEAPSNIGVLTTYAGTYSVTGAATGNPQRGESSAAHQRGTITIGGDGSVDFDTGIRFTPGQAKAVYDRRNQDFDRRVQVSYDADDSGRVINVYLDAERRVTEIQYRHSNAGINIRAAIGAQVAEEQDPTPPPPPPPPAGALDGRNGASAVVDGQRLTATGPITSSAIVLPNASTFNFLAVGDGGLSFNLTGQVVAGPQSCVQGSPVSANLNTAAGVINTWYATQCTIELTTLPPDTSTRATIAGRFSGTFARGPLSISVTDGEFRLLPDGN